jgi:3-hydroxyacyl-CoA dehydrogenase
MNHDPHSHDSHNHDHDHDHHAHDHDHHAHDHAHGHDHHHDHDHHHAHPLTPVAEIPAEALLVEALSLLGEGVTANRIEAAAHSIGLDQGVLMQMDTVGLELFDLALHAELDALKAVAQAAMPGARKAKVVSVRFPEPAVYVIEKMAHGFRRTGRASGGGFYDYTAGAEPQLWSGLKVFERGAREVDDASLAERLRAAIR